MLRAVLTKFSGIPGSLSRLSFVVHWWRWLRFIYVNKIRPHVKPVLARLIPIVLVAGASLLLAGHIQSNEWNKVLLTLGALLAAILFVARVDLALVAMIVITSTIIYPTAVPRPFSFGGGGFGTGELLLIFTLFVGLIKAYKGKRHPSSPLTMPLLLFFLSALLGLAVSYRSYLANPRGFFEFDTVYNAGRHVFYYMFFFAILYGIKNKREYKLVFHLVMALACVVSLTVFAQYVSGNKVNLFFGTAEGSHFVTSVGEDEVTRIQPPGLALVLPMVLTALWLASHYRDRAGNIYMVVAMILTSGIVFSFARNAWITVGAGIVMLLILAPLKVKPKLAAIVMGTVIGGVVLSFSLGSMTGRGAALQRALTDRFISIIEIRQTYESSSVKTRRMENRQAWAAIRRDPVFGVGMGEPIVQKYIGMVTSRGVQEVARSSDVIHNSYLDMWAHHGILGVVSFAWVSLLFLYRALSLWRRADEVWVKAIGLTFALAYLALLMRSLVVMTLVRQLYEIAVVAYMWGMVEVGFLVAVNSKGKHSANQDEYAVSNIEVLSGKH